MNASVEVVYAKVPLIKMVIPLKIVSKADMWVIWVQNMMDPPPPPSLFLLDQGGVSLFWGGLGISPKMLPKANKGGFLVY